MLADVIRTSRFHIKRVKPLWRCMHSLGIARLAKRLYESALLKEGQYTAVVLGRRLRFSVTTPREIERIEGLSGEHDFVTRMTASLRPGDVVFDVGANIGMISLLMATWNPSLDILVHAFEPEPQNADELEKNVALNGLEQRVFVQRLALGDRTGKAQLYVRGQTGCGTHSIIADGNQNATCVEIDIQTASDFACRTGAMPDVVKIDVEGAEMDVLHGMESLLREGAIRELFIEVHLSKLEQTGLDDNTIRQWLEARGLELTWSQSRPPEVHQHYRRTGR